MSGVRYRYVVPSHYDAWSKLGQWWVLSCNCIVHQTALYDTPDISVCNIRHQCIIQLSEPSVYPPPHLSMTLHTAMQCIMHQIHLCIVHPTSPYHAPDMSVWSIPGVFVSCTRYLCMIHQTSMYHTPDISIWYTRYHSIIRQILYHTTVSCHWIIPHHFRIKTAPRHNRVFCFSFAKQAAEQPTVPYTKHQTSLYPTANITVSYTRHHCILHQTSLYHTPDITVSYSKHHCIIHQTSLYPTANITVSYTRHHCFIHQTSQFVHQTSLYRTPDISVSYTRHHPVPTPDIIVLYTRHHCIIHQTSLYQMSDIIVSSI